MDKSITPERLMQFAWGYAPPLMIEAALKIGLFDVLDAGPKNLSALAAATKSSERGVRALANALVGFQLLAKKGDVYSLAPESAAFLVSTKPAFHGGIFRHMSAQSVPHWLRVADAVRTGKPVSAVNDPEQGVAFFQDLVEAIFPMSYAAAQAAARGLRVSEATSPYSVLDVAAGSGVWGVAFAQASPHVRVTSVDWEGVLPVTRRVAARFGLADRFTFVAGDIASADFGKGHRAATLGHILHSEGAEKSRKLLRRVFDALAPGGTIVIAEFVPDDDRAGPPMPLIFAVNMLLHTDVGDAFTYREISGWLAEAGFKDARRLDAPAPSPLILATKP
jgi:ubiquinone/menaquinone biosynthesis C-methylase UbiE